MCAILSSSTGDKRRTERKVRPMKNTYTYIIVGKTIVRVYTWMYAKNPNRKTHILGSKELWDRAEKYGYNRYAL